MSSWWAKDDPKRRDKEDKREKDLEEKEDRK